MNIIKHSATTHVGRVRKINEDSILSLPDQSIWVVSDGMGGHAGGDFASQAVVDAVAMIPPHLGPAELMQALRSSFHDAHNTIKIEADRLGGATIGATVVALALTEGYFVAFWAGDSRVYRFRDGQILMLSSDHSVVAELVHAGEMTWDEAELHPQSNAITRAVGVGDELEVDKVRGDAQPGDRFLLCSDGLTKYATFGILNHYVNGAPLETVCETLLNIALDAGGADNISIIVVDVV